MWKISQRLWQPLAKQLISDTLYFLEGSRHSHENLLEGCYHPAVGKVPIMVAL
jgi:hypothetical protein